MTRGRFTALSLTLVTLGGLAVFGLPRARRWGEERLRRTLEARASQIFGAPVHISRARIEFLPPGVRLEEVRAEREGNRGSQLILSTEEGSVHAGLFTLLGTRQGPLAVRAKRPHVALRLAEGRGVSLTSGAPAPGGAPLAAVPAGSTLDISGGVMEVDCIGGPAFKVEGVQLQAQPDAGGAIRGRAEFSSGSFQGPGGEWPGLVGDLSFVVKGPEARLDPLAIRGDGVALSGGVTVRSGDSTDLEGSADVSMDVVKLARFLPAAAGPSGQLKASLKGSLRDGTREATGRLEVENFVLWGLAIGTLRSDVVVDEGLHLKGIRAHLLGGEATGTSDFRFTSDHFEATTDLRLDGVDAAQVLDYAGWTGPPITGTIHYSGQQRIDSSGLTGMRGTGVVDAVGHYRSGRGQQVPLEVTVGLSIEGETVRLQNGTLRAGSTRATFSGRWSRAEGIILKLSGGTGNLSDILPLFAPPRKPGQARSPGPSPSPSPTPTPRPSPAPMRSPVPESSPAPSSRPASSRWTAGRAPVLLASWPPRRAGGRHALISAQAAGGGRPSDAAARRQRPAPAEESETPLERMVHALGGRWEWDGDLSYGRRGLTFTGRLTGIDLTYQGTPIGSLRARIVYGDDRLTIEEANLEAAPQATVSLSGRIDFRGEGALSIQGTSTAFPLTPVMAVIGMKAPIDGLLSGSIALGGRPDAPAGRAQIDVAPVVVAGLDFESLRGDLLFTPDILEMKPLTLAQGPGRISVEGRIPYRNASWIPEEGGGLPRIRIEGSDLDLSLWSKAAHDVPMEGIAAVEGTIEGTIQAPVGKVELRASSVKVRGFPVGAVTAEADLTGDAIALDLKAPDSGAAMSGRVGLGEGRPLDVKVSLSGTKIRGDTLMNGSPEDIQVTVGGEVTIRGSLADVTTLQARALLSGFEASVAGVTVSPEAPIEMTLEAGRMRLAPAVLSGPGTRVEIRADLDPGLGTIDLAASGRFDLKLLRFFMKKLQATGEGTVVLRVGGALADPSYEGRVVVEAQAVRHPDLPCPIDGLLGRAVFEGSHLKIESLEFLAGGGAVTGNGEIQFGDLLRFESPFTVNTAEIRFRGTGVKAEFPTGFRSVSDVDLTVRRAAGATSLKGTFDLVRGVYAKDFKLESFGRGRTGELFRPPVSDAFSAIDLDLSIRAPDNVWLRNDFGTIEMQGELDMRGTTDHPSLAGRITALEGGSIRFRNVEYKVLGGTIDFEDPEMINPIFDLQAETHVGEYQVTLSAEGSLDDFHYELSSNPPLPEQDIVALLLTGHVLAGTGSETGGLAEETIGSYLTGLTGEFAGKYKGKAGIDILSIDPLQANAQGDPTTRITIGKQVTPDLLATYSSDLGSSQGSLYQLDYALDRDFHFTSVRDTDGSIGGDFRYILRGKPPVMPGAAGTEEKGPILAAVRLEGDLRVEEKKVRRRLRLKVGKPRDRAAVTDGIDRVLKYYRDRRYLMTDMDDRETRTPEGKVELTFTVRAGPRIRIQIEGARLRAGIVQEVAPYWEKGLFPEDIVEEARAHIESIFRNRGYMRAQVASEVLRDDAQEQQVRFTVVRGERTQAREVRFEGVRQIPEKEVRKAISTRPDGLFSRGLVREARLQGDAASILELYLSRGFPLASVPAPDVAIDESGRRAVVTFRVEEGFKASFGRPEFEGNHAFPPDVLEKAAKVRAGDPYVVAELDAAVVRLRRRYDDAGYPDARIRCRVLKPAPEEEEVVSDPVFDIDEGKPQKVGTIDVAGNVITRDPVIRKALTVEPGESLSRSELQASQTRLYGRGIFSSVSVQAQPPAEGDQAGGGQADATSPAGIVTRDLRVAVREMAPLTQVFGLGYDSDERLRAQYEISNRNIFGGGRYVGFQARASDVQRRGTLSYREKGILGGNYDMLGSAFAENEERPSFTAQTIGSSIQVSRRFTRATRMLYRYSLRDIDLSDTSADFEGATVRLSGVAASAIHDTRDAPFDPTRGHSVSGEVQYYADAIGSEADFVKMYAQFYRFKTILPKTVWAQALRAGAAVPFGQSKAGSPLTCTEGDVQDSGVPPSERFFAGGDTTVRGFERFRLGGTCNGDPLGGEGLFILNEELRFPIHSLIGGVLFYDAGNVYRTLETYDVLELRHVAGAGLRLSTPIGPFRVEYGAILNRKPGDDRGQFFFSIGQAF